LRSIYDGNKSTDKYFEATLKITKIFLG
jgi:hypothetical protein